jgi:hypothetical protein
MTRSACGWSADGDEGDERCLFARMVSIGMRRCSFESDWDQLARRVSRATVL